MKAVTVCIILILQRPKTRSKTKDNQECLLRRLPLWTDGNITSLLEEGHTIQARLKFHTSTYKPRNLARSFADLMFRGKVRDALKLLSESDQGGPLSWSDTVSDSPPTTVFDVLKSKHPPAQPTHPETIVNKNLTPPPVHPLIFENLDAHCIRKAALNTSGAGGPTKLDAYCWRRLCTSFGKSSDDLCHSLALFARRLCTSHIHPDTLKPFLACRLIAINKKPGVRPIGICDVPRRIISKAILSVLKSDVMEGAGSLQLCAGQTAGIEAATHAARHAFEAEGCHGVLLVDASNAFNSLNRSAALTKIRHICPPISTVLCNCYRSPTELFVDGSTLYSCEGTTQGDPLAMPMYALATTPLIEKLSNVTLDITQVWYADDASASGTLTDIHSWWNHLSDLGPKFGYFPNGTKSWLIVKEEFLEEASDLFKDTDIHITSEGRPYLGSPLGSPTRHAYLINVIVCYTSVTMTDGFSRRYGK